MVPKFEKRVKAYAADLSAVTIAFLIASLGIKVMWLKISAVVLVYLLTSIIPIIISKGQTFGKRIQKIKVVNDNGSEANIFKLILRNLFKNLASIMTFGVYSIVAFFFVSEKHVSKTIHDHIFKTKVIDLTPPSKNKNDSYLGKSDSLTKRGL